MLGSHTARSHDTSCTPSTSAAQLVTDTRKYDHITTVLIELHWLPVETRIVFKILILNFKCLHGLAPNYRSDLIVKEVFSGASF